MTITVTAPNGSTVQFPDGTDHDTINSVMMQNFHPAKEPPRPDPVGVNDLARSAATGVPILGGLLNKADAATNAGLSYLLNPLFDPKDQLTGTLSERYAHSLRDQEGADTKFSEQHPIVDTGAKFAGGAAAMVPFVAAAPALFGAAGGIGTRIGAGAASGALLGGADAGIRSGDLWDTAKGIGVGGVLGGALPIAGAITSGVGRGILGHFRARSNPEGYADSQIARAVMESGKTPAALGQEVADANAAGQPFTLADALGNSGQRMLSTVARAPGEGRTAAVQFAESRQAGQGGRVGEIIDQGLGAGNTARQTTDQLTETARRESAPFYQKALDQKPVWNERLQQFFDDPVTNAGLREGVAVQRLESLAAGKKFDPSDYAITHFNEAGDPVLGAVPNMRTINLIKKGWDNQLEAYRDGTTGKLMLDEKGRALDAVRRSFLKEVDAVNPDYAKARALYAGPAQVRDAVTAGAQAATRGRAADNVARFKALTAPSQQGYRSGYADTVVGKAERAAEGANKARPLTSQKARTELGELSLHQGPVQPGALDPLQQRLAREQTMFKTNAKVLGGSDTTQNLNDEAAMAVDPHLIKNVLTGNWHGALGSVLSAGHTALTGNTAPVRAAIGAKLLDQGVTPSSLEKAIDDTIQRIQFVQKIARKSGRIGSLGVLPAANGLSQSN